MSLCNVVFHQQRVQEVKTPQYILNALKQEFDLSSFDPCPCPRPRGFNGLSADWAHLSAPQGAVYLNPPYDDIPAWLQKAHHEIQKGLTVVALLPARTHTKWFHEMVINKCEIRFVQGKVHFDNYEQGCPWGSMICVFKPTPRCRSASGHTAAEDSLAPCLSRTSNSDSLDEMLNGAEESHIPPPPESVHPGPTSAL